jgi:hypothetical protein
MAKHPAVVALLAAAADFLALDQPELDPDSPGATVDEAMVAEVMERLGAVTAAAKAGEIPGTELDEVNALMPAVEEKLEDWIETQKTGPRASKRFCAGAAVGATTRLFDRVI